MRSPRALPRPAFAELPDGPLAAKGYEAVNEFFYRGCAAPATPLPQKLPMQTLGVVDRELLFDLLACSGVPFPAARGLQRVYTDVEPGTDSQRRCERAGLALLARHRICVRP